MPTKPNQPFLKSKHIRFGITGKIWLAISIMFTGYIITIGQGAQMGNYTKQQHTYISDHLFPAALQAQTNMDSFKTQMDHYEYAVLLGEPERLQTADNYTSIIRGGLRKITDDNQLPHDIRILGNDLLLRHKAFSDLASSLYTKLTTEHPTEELRLQAVVLSETAEALKLNFEAMSTGLNHEVDDNLKAINQFFEYQRSTSILIFCATVTISIFLVSFILAKTILRPLQKTVHFANMMANGDLSQKVDINQHDEIGELATAMNTMAEQVELSYSRMEAIVAKRTLILRRTNEKLRIEVQSKQDAQKEIFHALDQAEQANEAKNTFLANMSHEIRTPMNGIIGMTGLLLETRISDLQKGYLHTLRASAQSLLSILNDILDFGKIESGNLQLDIQEFNPLDVIANITELLTLRVQDMGLEFSTLIDWKIPPILQGDQARLRQILLNITDNAIKFTKSGEISLKMEIEDKTDQTITLRCAISDTGIGISQDKIDNIFKPFIQADGSRTRKYGGTGLGLAISKKLIELMDGEIQIESELHKGTTVWFTATFGRPVNLDHFPAYSQSTELIYSTTSSPQSDADKLLQLAGKNILMAEDEPTNQNVIIAILQTFGISPHIVPNGQQALNALDLQSFDLILMDCQMPIMDGYEATRAIRKREGAEKDIPIIALTADTTPEAQNNCLSSGMNDYLTKPVEPQLLKEYLLKWLHPKPQLVGPPLLVAKLVLKRQGGDRARAIQTLSHALEITHIHLDELVIAQFSKYPKESTNNLCNEVKKLGAHLGIAKLQNNAIHLQLALKNKQQQQVDDHAQSLRMNIERLRQELTQAGKDYDSFFNS